MAFEPPLGSIGLTRIKGDVGWLIRIGQWLNGDGFADFEHAFTYVGDGKIVEAEPGGALLSPLARYDLQRVVWLRCPEQFGPGVADAARKLVGTPYSFLDYFALALHRFRIPVPWLRKYIGATGHEMCSALADRAAMIGGWHLFTDDRWEGGVTPGALHRLLV